MAGQCLVAGQRQDQPIASDGLVAELKSHLPIERQARGIGDLSRFEHPRALMSYLGLVHLSIAIHSFVKSRE
ncbi:hypothetical protein A167_01531 [Alcanivorax sp. S71-1-4]|nr:hypothetical protein A167_01531 [Alcanivorax sp. S71-1-4]